MHETLFMNSFLAVILALTNYYLLSFEVGTIFGSLSLFRKTCFVGIMIQFSVILLL